MLRAVAFQNFIYFRDHQSLEFEDGPNFIVGPNASGKSAIFELIRRCLPNSANASTSRVADTNFPAFVICKFEIRQKLSIKVLKEFPAEDSIEVPKEFPAEVAIEVPKEFPAEVSIEVPKEFPAEVPIEVPAEVPIEVPAGCHVYSCVYLKDLEMYKLVCITNTDKQQGKCYLEYYPSVSESGPQPNLKAFTLHTKSSELSKKLDMLMKNKPSHVTLHDMLDKMMKENKKDAQSGIIGCEDILKAIHDAVVVTFPIRSPGPIQWSHSKNIGEGNEHYVEASIKAEILQELLQSDDVDEEESKKIFETIIHPVKYHFKKNQDSTITVNDGAQEIRFLKVPEGIIEAKEFSLMYVHKKYQTLVLEEPARGMHPHMIHKLRDLVFRTHSKDKRKVMLITTHQTAMVNQWSMSRMFICRRTRNAEDKLEHRVFKLSGRIERIYEFEDIFKEMVFSEAVLFVEGITDKKVIRSVFDRIFEAEQIVGSTERQADLQKIAARTQIISIGGSRKDILDNLKETGKQLEIPCKFLFDRDTKSDCLAEVQPKDGGKKWKNAASFCARTLFKRTKEYRDENQVEESKEEKDNLERVMDTLTNTGGKLKDNLGLKGDLKEVEQTDVVSFIRRVILPTHLPRQEAEENSEENIFTWKSGNLEDVICKSILGDQTEEQQSGASTPNQTDIDVGLLQKMFLCEYYDDRKRKDPVKETLKQMGIETAKELSIRLLKRGEMLSFLQFLSDIEHPNRDRTNSDKTTN